MAGGFNVLSILHEDLGGALPVLESYPGSPEDPKWTLDRHGDPVRLFPKSGRHFLDAYMLRINTPMNVGREVHRFAEMDRVFYELRRKMREILSQSLAKLVESARFAGDFRILTHTRSFHQDLTTRTMHMDLEISVAMCGLFLDNFGGEWDIWPSPKRILSKIQNLKIADEISKEMTVHGVMSV